MGRLIESGLSVGQLGRVAVGVAPHGCYGSTSTAEERNRTFTPLRGTRS